MSQTRETPTCPECGYKVDSREHMGGVGLHGHQATTEEEANEQRADVMARAQAFSDKVLAAQEAAEAAYAAVMAPAAPVAATQGFDAMSYKELQALGKERGLKVVGITRAALVASLGAA